MTRRECLEKYGIMCIINPKLLDEECDEEFEDFIKGCKKDFEEFDRIERERADNEVNEE